MMIANYYSYSYICLYGLVLVLESASVKFSVLYLVSKVAIGKSGISLEPLILRAKEISAFITPDGFY